MGMHRATMTTDAGTTVRETQDQLGHTTPQTALWFQMRVAVHLVLDSLAVNPSAWCTLST